MSKLRKIGNITHGEKYEKDGQTKYKNTQLGTLFRDDEKGEYVVKYLGQWCKVWVNRETNSQAAPQQQSAPTPNDLEDEILF